MLLLPFLLLLALAVALAAVAATSGRRLRVSAVGTELVSSGKGRARGKGRAKFLALQKLTVNAFLVPRAPRWSSVGRTLSLTKKRSNDGEVGR